MSTPTAVRTLAFATALCVAAPVCAQLLSQPPIPPKEKRQKTRRGDLEWMWQYSPPPEGGRENELIQDSHFLPFLHQYFTAPQSFWGPAPADPKDPTHKSLADTIYDFLAIPGQVQADDNRYITVTGAVYHFRTSRGLLFADLDAANPLVVFAAIDWIRDSKTTTEPDAEYTLWIFPARDLPLAPGSSTPLPSPLVRSLTRWMAQPVPGTGIVQKITHAILVAPDGTPQQIPVPGVRSQPATAPAPARDETPVLPPRPPS